MGRTDPPTRGEPSARTTSKAPVRHIPTRGCWKLVKVTLPDASVVAWDVSENGMVAKLLPAHLRQPLVLMNEGPGDERGGGHDAGPGEHDDEVVARLDAQLVGAQVALPGDDGRSGVGRRGEVGKVPV